MPALETQAPHGATPFGELTLRPASADDAAAITALLTGAALPLAGVNEMLARDPSQFIVAEHATDGLVAMAGIEECCRYALLRSVAVRGDWQRRGLGHTLVERAVAHAEARGIAALYLLTMTAEHYFPRFGFETVARASVPPEVSRTVEFTSACPASAVTMCRTLHPLIEES